MKSTFCTECKIPFSGFGGEREKWASMSKKLEQQFIQLTGDILLATGTVAYLGYFPQCERQKEIVKWQKRAKELDVPFSQDYSLQVISNIFQILEWFVVLTFMIGIC